MKIVADRGKLRENLEAVANVLRGRGIEPMGVVKGVCGNAALIDLFVDAGYRRLGESRSSTLSALRNSLGDRVGLDLIRPPATTEIADTARAADGSFHCRTATVAAIVAACDAERRPHDVTLIVDVGHGREGFAPDRLEEAADLLSRSAFARLAGISCYLCRREPPDLLARRLAELDDRRRALEQRFGRGPVRLSVGSSLFFGTALAHPDLLDHVDEFRVGTAALLGVSSSIGPQYIDFLSPDTFRLELEIMQVRGDRSILPIGLYDADPKDLIFAEGLSVDVVFSDHLVLKSIPGFPAREGDLLSCRMNYYSLNRLLGSPHMKFELI